MNPSRACRPLLTNHHGHGHVHHENLTEATQASRLLVLLLLVVDLGKGRLYLALEQQP